MDNVLRVGFWHPFSVHGGIQCNGQHGEHAGTCASIHFSTLILRYFQLLYMPTKDYDIIQYICTIVRHPRIKKRKYSTTSTRCRHHKKGKASTALNAKTCRKNIELVRIEEFFSTRENGTYNRKSMGKGEKTQVYVNNIFRGRGGE